MGKPVNYDNKKENLQNLINDLTKTLKQKNDDLQKLREEQEKFLEELENDPLQESPESIPPAQFDH